MVVCWALSLGAESTQIKALAEKKFRLSSHSKVDDVK